MIPHPPRCGLRAQPIVSPRRPLPLDAAWDAACAIGATILATRRGTHVGAAACGVSGAEIWSQPGRASNAYFAHGRTRGVATCRGIQAGDRACRYRPARHEKLWGRTAATGARRRRCERALSDRDQWLRSRADRRRSEEAGSRSSTGSAAHGKQDTSPSGCCTLAVTIIADGAHAEWRPHTECRGPYGLSFWGSSGSRSMAWSSGTTRRDPVLKGA